MPIYLDHAASWPLRPAVIEAISGVLPVAGNASSVHSFGQTAKELLEQAREDIAEAISADRNEVVFVSGGTESNNSAIKGLYWQAHAQNPSRRVIVTSPTEHHAVLDSIEWLVREQGAEAVYLRVNEEGEVDLADLEELLKSRASEIALISLMWVNNETGLILPIAEIAKLANEYGIPMHSDAVAALGHIEINFSEVGLAAMSITAHKVGGPHGIGALIVRRGIEITPVFHGGDHELTRRAGSSNVHGAVGFAAALKLAVSELAEVNARHKLFSDRIEKAITEIAPEAVISSKNSQRVAGTVHLRLPGTKGETLMFLLDQRGIAVSTGSACTAGVSGPSHVVMAMGAQEEEANSSLRISFGPDTTDAEIEAFLESFALSYPLAKLAGEVARA